ncbi:FAD-dependent oxidoreductase [Rhodoplanes sp. TEM]|uniref:FAD-dependent oxidoreductase n=1 Tax=Rhodoplanes tepidamans TaxID=200616 RepID=A0ABT5J9L4_RHOTP|nr:MULTISPECIES: FAD-dependent oxidoreductase [Rhodoplanes]MDC7786297.1 FAD-dependent oxidoreductase [Rhodoplanes tepidamans]MDC7982332.1 FAD-dependent oxidoreductase [Rhodoplanes sp. TEM]MDQ0355096.1 2-polyprenyl-6-methoxyphenol hydroxylase-like FAD-dependent oxidoreductase [Rhodoplanes tepidamans]
MANDPAETAIEATCCVVGGGPAGMMLGVLLARAGLDVMVLEKHADFLRDFRGDTIHPSTLELMHELGILDDLLKQPYVPAPTIGGDIAGTTVTVADFRHLPVRCGFVAFMPQWDFLNFMAAYGARFPGFRLKMRHEATDLVEEAGRVAGVRASSPDGPVTIRADLVVACDGRHSTLRARAGFAVTDIGAPMDVMWFRLPRRPDDVAESLGVFVPGGMLVTIDRGDYWQCAYVIPKGSADTLRAAGLPAFRAGVARIKPAFANRVEAIADWDAVKLLTVTVDRLPRWHRPGLLCIGDAAHAMSPIGGVGINLAVQDAVAAANILAAPLAERRADDAVLARVQARREWPTVVTQRLQVLIQNRVVARVLGATEALSVPLPLRLLQWFPPLRRLPARLIGMGVRPEHIATPEAPRPAPAR